MRIYAVADIHQKQHRMDKIDRAMNKFSPDILVIAGDIANYGSPKPLLIRLAQFGIPVLAIRGNTDFSPLHRIQKAVTNLHSLHFRDFACQDRCFIGISGTFLLPFRSRTGFFENRQMKKLAPLVKKNTIIVTHPPPYGVHDKVLGRFNVGSVGLRRLILDRKPGLVFCGHIHENPGVSWLESTLVVNCTMGNGSNGIIVDWEKDGKPQFFAA